MGATCARVSLDVWTVTPSGRMPETLTSPSSSVTVR